MADIANRRDYESQLTAVLVSQSDQHAAEIRSRLQVNPTAPIDQAYWDKVERDRRNALAAILILLFMDSASAHGGSSDRMREAGLAYIGPKATDYAARYADRLQQKFDAAQSQWKSRGATLDPSIPIVTQDEIDELTRRLFNDEAANSDATTAVSDVVTDASEIAVGDAGLLSDDDTWHTMPTLTKSGPCPVCKDLDKKPRPIWAAKFPNGPPAHPNCVCYIDYVFMGTPV